MLWLQRFDFYIWLRHFVIFYCYRLLHIGHLSFFFISHLSQFVSNVTNLLVHHTIRKTFSCCCAPSRQACRGKDYVFALFPRANNIFGAGNIFYWVAAENNPFCRKRAQKKAKMKAPNWGNCVFSRKINFAQIVPLSLRSYSVIQPWKRFIIL